VCLTGLRAVLHNVVAPLVVLVMLLFLNSATADRTVVIEHWTSQALGRRGIPFGWTGETFGRRAEFDFVIEQEADQRILHLRSRNEHSTIVKDITGTVSLKETPILQWTWKVTMLPKGGDLRRKETTDIAAQLYVVWPRVPKFLGARIIGYVWDGAAPPGAIVPSQKTGTITFIVIQSGSENLGTWVTERRNVYEDYERIFHEPPDQPRAITLSIDSNDTHSEAESFIGPVMFRAP